MLLHANNQVESTHIIFNPYPGGLLMSRFVLLAAGLLCCSIDGYSVRYRKRNDGGMGVE